MAKRITRRDFLKGTAAGMASLSVSLLVGAPRLLAEETDAVDFAEQMEAFFAEPEMKYRPYARWWLAEGSHTDNTLLESIEELYNAGYGGVEFVTLNESALDPETFAWGSAEWVHDTKVIINKCQELGMSVSVTSGTNWSNANLPADVITPDDQAASQELGYTVTASFTGSYTGNLEVCVLPGDSTKQTLVRVIAARVVENGETGALLDMSSMTDVTELATADDDGGYSISYSGEDAQSEYMLFAFYQYGTSETASPSISTNYVINYLDKAGMNAVIDYWNENVLTDDLKEVINQIDEFDMYMDSLELGTQGENTAGLLWCEDMLTQFSDRMGYDLGCYLPFMITTSGQTFSNVSYVYSYEPDTDTEGFATKLRNDFYQVMTQLYMENCLDVLREWLHENHMYLRAETSYGLTLEISQPIKAVDYIETESLNFGNELDSYRSMSGGAHVYGKRYSSETGAVLMGNYRYDSAFYRQMYYLQYAAGIQKTVIHGYSSAYGPEASTNWPRYDGMSSFYSARFNDSQPAAVDYTSMNDHFSRIQMVLEQGVPQIDLAMLRTDYKFDIDYYWYGAYSGTSVAEKTRSNEGIYWQDTGLQNAGYTYDYLSPYTLIDEEVSSNGSLVNADGVAYQALIVMEDELPYGAAVRMLEWAEEGLPIVFVNRVTEIIAHRLDDENARVKVNTIAASTTGSNDGKDADLQEIVEQMKALDNVVVVDSTEEALSALQELGVYPRVQYAEANSVILPVLRRADDADYLYLYNYMYENEENFTGQISLDGEYTPYLFETWSGAITQIADYSVQDGRTILNVELAPGDVKVFILKKESSEEVTVTDTENVYKILEENGQIYAALENSETAAVMFSDGSSQIVQADAPENIALSGWNLVVTSYEEGDMLTRTETTEETGVTSTEVKYDTNYVELDAGVLEELVPWKDIAAIGEAVSGLGTYTNTFELPEDWTAQQYGVVFCADSFSGGTAAMWVNDQQVPVNMDNCTADISAYVKGGSNTITVRVSSSLRNVIYAKYGADNYSGWKFFGFMGGYDPEIAEYGMTGETKLITYEKIAVEPE